MKEKLTIQTIDDLKAEIEGVLYAVQMNYERDGFLVPVAFMYKLSSDVGEVKEVRVLGLPGLKISGIIAQAIIRKTIERYGIDLIIEVSEATLRNSEDNTAVDVVLFYAEGKRFRPMAMSVEVDEKEKKVLTETKCWTDEVLDGNLILGLYTGLGTDA